MALKNKITPYVVANGTSMASSFNTTPTCILEMDVVGYSLVWTGNPTGTFAVQVSTDYTQAPNGVVTNAGNWTSLTLSGTPSVTGAAGNGYIDVYGTSAAWVRISYTASSGSGNLTAVVTAKAL